MPIASEGVVAAGGSRASRAAKALNDTVGVGAEGGSRAGRNAKAHIGHVSFRPPGGSRACRGAKMAGWFCLCKTDKNRKQQNVNRFTQKQKLPSTEKL